MLGPGRFVPVFDVVPFGNDSDTNEALLQGRGSLELDGLVLCGSFIPVTLPLHLCLLWGRLWKQVQDSHSHDRVSTNERSVDGSEPRVRSPLVDTVVQFLGCRVVHVELVAHAADR